VFVGVRPWGSGSVAALARTTRCRRAKRTGFGIPERSPTPWNYEVF
jgi:hypothetical protein